MNHYIDMQKQNQIYDLFYSGKKLVALLIDPDKFNKSKIEKIFKKNICLPDLIFVGGSLLVEKQMEEVISFFKKNTKIPVVLFPGNSMQISKNADAILFISLISGRNPDFLIGQHVLSAPYIAKTQLEVIPTSYILIDGGVRTSVEYISQTAPIPSDKTDIALATALAGKYLGHKLIYLEAGSGAKNSVPTEMIKVISEKTNLPIIVGGGIRSEKMANHLLKAGASTIVIGNLFETNPDEALKIIENIKTK